MLYLVAGESRTRPRPDEVYHMHLTEEQIAAIAASRGDARVTLRATAPGMEAWLHQAIPVLDHGVVRVVDYMGDDAAIVQAARVSYGAGTKTARDDAGLIRYLMRHWHSTPFEMCEIKGPRHEGEGAGGGAPGGAAPHPGVSGLDDRQRPGRLGPEARIVLRIHSSATRALAPGISHARHL
jgi:hypothetical protein